MAHDPAPQQQRLSYSSRATTQTCESRLGFLARDKMYETVKPYKLRYEPSDSTPRDNLVIESRAVTIHDARAIHTSLDTHGFTLMSIPSQMRYEDYQDANKIVSVYTQELSQHLRKIFGARHTRVIDYAIRRRHPDFPISTGENYAHQQPVAMVHLDFSHEEGINMLEKLYGNHANKVLQSRWCIVNTWRPLAGPLYDWPLAVCEAPTFSKARDSQDSDAVWPDWAYENVLVHAHTGHVWYYFSGMLETETLVFKCTDSDPTACGPCPHASFCNPYAGKGEKPRESIESRVFLMWTPMEKLPKEVADPYGRKR